MSFSKTLLVAAGLVFAAMTVANAGPKQTVSDSGYKTDYSSTIPGKAHQDRFNLSN